MKKNIFAKLIIFVFVLSFTQNVLADELIPEIPTEETPEVIPEPIALVENIFIRNGEDVIYDSAVDLPENGIVNVLDSNGNNHEVNSRSVLGLIYVLSQKEDASFAISNLQYYSSMNAFYLKCITPKGGSELCDNWQYVVGGVTPWTGIDQTFVSGGEQVGLYFGTPHKLALDKNEILEGELVKVNSFKYNYLDDTWGILPEVSIDVTVPNPLDVWNPTIVSSTKVDENGSVVISIPSEGVYTFGIKEDYSFPSYQVTVKKPTVSEGGSTGGSTVGDSGLTDFSISNAINFLLANEDNDGSFGDSLYTDWVAISIAQAGEEYSGLKNKIYDFLKKEEFRSTIITDNERHAMALMAMGINPYDGTNINYIEKIISSFDGTQIGDDSLYNDDIFSLIVLSHAGYTNNDEIIKSVVSYIISKQDSGGSWGNVDMTAAGIQSLINFKSLSGVKKSIENAELYLKNNQNADGGFGNSFSTSWATQALSQNNSFDSETNIAINYLKDKQQSDGGLDGGDIKSRVWATSYAIPAVLKLSWNDILESFDKPKQDNINKDEDVEELSTEKETQDPVLSTEVKGIEFPVMSIDLAKIKKENFIKNEVVLPVEEKINNNLLGANAIDIVQKPSIFLPIINKILDFIFTPFMWLWVHLNI